MKKPRKFKDELSRRDSKRKEKTSKGKKAKLRPENSKQPKYRHQFLNEEE